MKANSYANKGEFTNALKLYNTILLNFPKNIRAQQGLAALNAPKQTNSGQNPPQYGWSIDANSDGWWSGNGITSTSGGNFAELSNGNAQSGTQAAAVVYTMTTAQPINVFDSII